MAEYSDAKPMWCVVISKPMNEELAEKSIREAGYGSYLPRYQKLIQARWVGGKTVRCAKGGEIVMRPLFPRYGFAELWPDQQWGPIKEAKGVMGLIMSGDRPATISGEVIELIREIERNGEFDEVRRSDKPRTDLQIGGLVRIPEHQMVGKLLALDEKGRAQVLMDFLGRQVKPWVEAKTLQVVAA